MVPGVDEGPGVAEESAGGELSSGEEPPAGTVSPGAGGSESASAGGGSGEMSSPLPRICGGTGAVSPTPDEAEEEAGPCAIDLVEFALERRSAISAADFKVSSPTLERSCSIRFFASSLSRDPGCCRSTSL